MFVPQVQSTIALRIENGIVVWLIFLIGVVNLCLGFALAIYLEPTEAREIVLTPRETPIAPQAPDLETPEAEPSLQSPVT